MSVANTHRGPIDSRYRIHETRRRRLEVALNGQGLSQSLAAPVFFPAHEKEAWSCPSSPPCSQRGTARRLLLAAKVGPPSSFFCRLSSEVGSIQGRGDKEAEAALWPRCRPGASTPSLVRILVGGIHLSWIQSEKGVVSRGTVF